MSKSICDYPPTLTVKEAASLLRIGRNSAYRLIHEGKLYSYNVGRKIFVPRKSVENYLSSGN